MSSVVDRKHVYRPVPLAKERSVPSLSNVLSSAVERLLFHPVTLTHAETIGGCFRRLRLQGEVFRGVKWVPGQAVQIYLGNLTKRAYTPMEMEPDAGSAEFLIYIHGGGPGSEWAASLTAGDVCKVTRLKDSLNLMDVEEHAIFFGDDTSIAAAYALQSCERVDARHHFVLEVTSAAETKSVVDCLGLRDVTLYQRTDDGEHLAGLVSKLAEIAGKNSEGIGDFHKSGKSERQVLQWLFTGQAQSIQRVQKDLRRMGVEVRRSKVRAYWSLELVS
jgi:ferric-chelate reductase (NADPH)